MGSATIPESIDRLSSLLEAALGGESEPLECLVETC